MTSLRHRGARLHLTGFIRGFIVLVLVPFLGRLPAEDRPPPAAGANLVEFVPGLRIDWSDRRVEIDARVVLREGPLELFACIAQTREHESIVIVRPRPLHIYQALGLVGLEPGSPVTWDEKNERWNPPTGDRVSVEIRHQRAGVERVDPIEHWMLDARTRVPPEPIEWVFAGSRFFEKNKFGADFEGTVVCVVDFETAVIAPRALHSSSNDQLWLVANPDAVPPLGTPCTIVIRPHERLTQLVVTLQDDGTLRRHNSVIKPGDIARLLRRPAEASRGPRVMLVAGSTVADEVLKSAVESLCQAGVPRESIETKRIDEKPPASVPPSPALDNQP